MLLDGEGGGEGFNKAEGNSKRALILFSHKDKDTIQAYHHREIFNRSD